MIYNFGAGPALLPEPVMKKIQAEWLDWNNTGVSIAEISHRDPQYRELLNSIEAKFRALMGIPDNYKVLFLQGGAQGQFALIPMNLLGKNKYADYLCYGLWSDKAASEADRYGDIHAIKILSENQPMTLSNPKTWSLNPKAAYTHYCSNETVDGMRMGFVPNTETPLVVDMSSDILSEPIDVSRFGVIYACVQKNLGIAGLTIVIVRDDLLDQAMELTPSVFSYRKQVDAESLYNTIPTVSCYAMGLILDWMVEEGGLAVIQARNHQKAALLYHVIDESNGFYHNKVAPSYRSLMNVTFYFPHEKEEADFLAAAEQQGLLFLRGHRTRGGLRASIYNAMPMAGVEALAAFMQKFKERKAL